MNDAPHCRKVCTKSYPSDPAPAQEAWVWSSGSKALPAPSWTPRSAGERGGSLELARGEGIRPHLHIVWGRVNLLNHRSKCQAHSTQCAPINRFKVAQRSL